MNRASTDNRLILKLLEAVDHTEYITQRNLARDMGIALGLANAYLKKCIQMGLVSVEAVSANRYFYNLTAKGELEKIRLASESLCESFSFYRKVSDSCAKLVGISNQFTYNRLYLLGCSEMAEIFLLNTLIYGVDISGIVDAKSSSKFYIHKPVYRDMSILEQDDLVVLTEVEDCLSVYKKAKAQIPTDRILVPDVLKQHMTH